jgi:hypothetical protein
MPKVGRQIGADTQESPATPPGRKTRRNAAKSQSRSTPYPASQTFPAARKTARRPRARTDNKIYEFESDLCADKPVTTRELDALIRLLGSDIDAFLSDGG